MSTKTSLTTDLETSCRLAVLCDIEDRGKLDQIRFMIKKRVEELGLSEKEFERRVKKKIEEAQEGVAVS